MTDKVSMKKILCGGGLNSKDNYLDMSDNYPSFATRLINFEPSLYGGYRRLSGFVELNDEYPEVDPANTEGKILGVFIFGDDILAARKDQSGNTYSFYQYVPGNTWTKISGAYAPVSTGVEKVRYDTFNFDGTEKIAFVDGINPLAIYDGSSFTVPTGNQDLGKPSFVTVFENHVFVSGDIDDPHIVAHSGPNDEAEWDVADGAGQIVAGFDVTQIRPWRNSLIVFGRTKIKNVTVSGTSFVLNNMTEELGCVSSDSVIEANGDLMFLSQDGIRPISATERNEDFELSSISKNIQNLFTTSFSGYNLVNVNAVTVKSKSQVRFFLSQENISDEQAKGLISGLTNTGSGQRWEWGELRGIKVSCVTSSYIGNIEYVIHGGFDGVVYRQEQGSSFNGENIWAVYTTPYLDYGDPTVRKTLRAVHLFVRPEGSARINLGIRYNWGSSEVHNPGDFEYQSLGNSALWNEAVYNQGVYNGSVFPYIFRNVFGSGFSHNVTITTNDTNASYSIQGIVMEVTPNGYE